jgi:anti-sigma regulatory factor (Ser/Thr protein kinase)
VRHRYAPVPGSCSAARRDLRAFLLPQGFDDDLVQDLLLVANELVANAVDHARTSFTVTVTLLGSVLRIEVADGSAEPPRLKPRDPSSARGHGLRVVDAISSAWSVTRTLTGKTVQADLAIA